jgi:hypothetical protein
MKDVFPASEFRIPHSPNRFEKEGALYQLKIEIQEWSWGHRELLVKFNFRVPLHRNSASKLWELFDVAWFGSLSRFLNGSSDIFGSSSLHKEMTWVMLVILRSIGVEFMWNNAIPNLLRWLMDLESSAGGVERILLSCAWHAPHFIGNHQIATTKKGPLDASVLLCFRASDCFW